MFGRFASMRDNYLWENKPVSYEKMIREGKLRIHLEEIDAETQQMLKSSPAPERKNQLEWVKRMNSLKYAVEGIVLVGLIYV